MLIVIPAPGWDSLATLAQADAYHQKMGQAAWAQASEPDREAALRRATQYIVAQQVKVQYLDPLHENVLAATCEAAARALDGSLYADIDPQAVTSERVGSIAVTYADRNGGKKKFPIIDDLLRGLTMGGGKVKVERA